MKIILRKANDTLNCKTINFVTYEFCHEITAQILPWKFLKLTCIGGLSIIDIFPQPPLSYSLLYKAD